MLLSLNWLREFVPYEGGAEELGAKLTFLGLELEELSRPFAGLKDLLVGHVVECGRHPDADKLSVCRVDVGQEILDIVCGAPNVAKGQYVVVAPVGSELPGGLVIKKAKLRGAPSNGMLCSERELGLSEEHDGIMVLENLIEGSFTPGSRALDVLKLDEEVLDISITPNRADCLSVLGLARETALAFNLPLNLPGFSLEESGSDLSGEWLVEVAEAELSPLYQLRLIEGAAVKRSPARLRWRLQAVGQRAISNVVDVTNYILMELGQPLHAFDRERLAGGRITVAPALPGEKFTTLDGQERALNPADITIRDAEKAVALAGVMGGLNSRVDENTQNILLESAVFSPRHIRRTARRLSLPSDASYRFERGVDQSMNTFAMDKAAAMIASLSGGRVRKGAARREARPLVAVPLVFRPQRAKDLIGVEIEDRFASDTLRKLGCRVEESAAESWRVTPPGHRLDLTREVDLIEEVARVYGVDRVPEILPKIGRQLERAGQPETRHAFIGRLKRRLSGLGLNEAVNYSFVGQKDLDLLGLPKEERIAIMNPLSADQDVLRTALAPGLLNNLRQNISQGNNGVRLFEVANAFTLDPSSPTTAHEESRLALMVYGEVCDRPWPQNARDADYLDIKGLAEYVLDYLRVRGAVFRKATGAHSWLNPCVEIISGDKEIGFMGRLKSEIAEACHARKEVWLAELRLDVLRELHDAAGIHFDPLPVYPPVRRDITVIAPLGLEAEAVNEAVYAEKPAFLEAVQLIDLFAPEGKNVRNLTYRLTFRHPERTLKDAEVDKTRDAVAQALVKKLGVEI